MLGTWRRRIGSGARMEIISVLYLVLPVIIFIIGWLKPLIALPLLVALIVCLWFYFKQSITVNYSPKIRFRRAGVIGALVLIIGWTLISGVGNLGVQSIDYEKHNAVTADLVKRDWPVIYELPQRGDAPLVYYIAYYLPASAVGKLYHQSINVANAAMLLWAIAGMALVFYWASRLAGKSTVLLALLLIGFSGMDIIGSIFTQTADGTWPLINRGSKMEVYTWPVLQTVYPSHATALFWAPQHTIAGWLMALLLACIFIEKRKPYGAIFVGILGLLWSPLVVIGLLPIYACLYLSSRNGWRHALTVPDVLAVILLCVPLVLFFQAAAPQSLHSFFSYNPVPSFFEKIGVLALFLLIEFGVYAILLYRYVRKKESHEWYILFVVSCLFLSILPLLRLGMLNDLVMRACVPGLAILAVLAYRYLSSRQTNAGLLIRQQILWVTVGIGFINPLIQLNVQLLSKRMPIADWVSVGSDTSDPDRGRAMDQYRGDHHSLFFRELTRNN